MKLTIEKTVYFVRHGQSAGNVAPIFQPPTSPLNELGKMQAESVAKRASNLSFEALIASPFPRAKETAEAIAKATNKPIEFSDMFVERLKPTSIDGKSYEDSEADRIWREWEKSLHTSGMRIEDGENFDDLLARADKALTFLEDRPEQSLLVVTHGYFLRTIVLRVLLGDLITGEVCKRFHRTAATANTGITVLQRYVDFEGVASWHLWIYNDHAHLG